VAAILFAVDQAAKYLVLRYIPEGESWAFLPFLAKLFQFTHITNTGAAFGSFPGLGEVLFKWVAVGVIIAIFAEILFFHSLPTEHIGVRVSLGLILGGAMGNLMDRLVRPGAAVVDFIDIGFWPIGNIADFSIIFGVCILAYYLWNEEQHSKPSLHVSNEGGKV
jgi:signal peptidase II